MKEDSVDLYLTPAEVASVFGITVQGVHKLCKEQGILTRNKGERKHKIYPDSFCELLKLRKKKHPTAKVAVHSVKGGVGKTTMVHALASRASAYGFKTLMVDLDKQANLTNSFGLYPDPDEVATFFDVYEDSKKRKNTVIDSILELTEYLHLLPASLNLANLDVAMTLDTPNVSNLFKKIFAPISRDYDLIFFDLAPDFNRVTFAAHCYSDTALIPVNMDRFSLRGVEMTYDHLDYLQENFEHETKRLIVVNKFDARHSLAFEIMGVLGAEYKKDLCENAVPVSKAVENSLANDNCVWEDKVSKNPALEGFENVLKSFLKLDDWKVKSRSSRSKSSHNITRKKPGRSARK